MIPLQKIRQISNNNRVEFFSRHGKRTVLIYSRQWGAYWRPNGNGYTSHRNEAGEYTLSEAWKASGHCGPEKQIFYHFVNEPKQNSFVANLAIGEIKVIENALLPEGTIIVSSGMYKAFYRFKKD